jgi:UDP-GlcNAc:undecaprenyl-phosphate GlcNAc-1-phosphate transferase
MSESLYNTVLHCFFFFAMMAFSLLITSILLRFVKTLGTKNQPGALVRWSADTKPAIGGLTFFIVFLVSLSAYSFLFDPTEIFQNQRIVTLIAAATVGFLMGLTDDAYNTKPLLKLIIQIICGAILIVGGTVVAVFDNDLLNYALTILWTVGIMNSINMLDNMDGIAASVTSFILISAIAAHAIVSVFPGVDMLILLGVLAALLSFLFYNWNPSSIYMGDTGSQFLGVILAYVGIHYCWNVETLVSENGNLLGVAALLTVFMLPITDTAIVTINRLRRRQSPFVGGKDHTTHNLSYSGLMDNQVALLFCAISISGLGSYVFMLTTVGRDDYALIAVYLAIFLAVFLTMFFVAEKNKERWGLVVKKKKKKGKTVSVKSA